MSSKPKIVVFQLKELIYTAIFVVLGILLILLLVFMFLPRNSDDSRSATPTYHAGVYTSSLVVNNTPMEIEVIVDSQNIKSVKVSNLSEAVMTMLPLVASAIDDISEQVVSKQSLDSITYTEDNQYTYMVLTEGIQTTLDKALVEKEKDTEE